MHSRIPAVVRIGYATAAVAMVVTGLGCATSPSGDTTGGVTGHGTQPPWRVTYHDGNNNGYEFWQDTADGPARFSYEPMTPERSSSGVYSGGEPRAGALAPSDADRLWELVAALEADPTIRATARRMGTGALRITTPAGTRELVVDPGPGLSELDGFAAGLR